MTTLTIELPDDMAAMARREGLLSSDAIRDLLAEATRVAAMQRLQGLWAAEPAELQSESPLSSQALQTIIDEVRRQRLS